MSNDYYNADTLISRHSKAKSPVLNSIFQAISSGFGMLPSKDKLHQNRVTHYADTGTADNYVITMDPVPASYVDGLSVRVVIGNTNTGACTVNVNALGARPIKAYDNSTPATGDLIAGDVVDLVFHASRNAFLMLSQSRTFTVRAETAAGSAETAKGTAETAASQAVTARDLAVIARGAAEDAQEAAESAASGSLTKAANLADLDNKSTARSALGLGDAATKTVQSSLTDTISGKVMLNGGHGLGALIGPMVADLDALDATKFFREAGATGSPAAGAATIGLHLAGGNSNHALQIAARASDDKIWWRRKNTAWDDWHEFMHRGNILGAVSTSGGLPTGDLFETGGGSDGTFYTNAAGLLVCEHRMTADAMGPQTWNFPAAFAAPPQVTVSPVSGSPHTITIQPPSTTTTYVEFNCFDLSGTRQAKSCHLIAIGPAA